MANAFETLLPDEKYVIDLYRRAKVEKYAALELHLHDGCLVQRNLVLKDRPIFSGAVRLREKVA